jgi:hypothetical protein
MSGVDRTPIQDYNEDLDLPIIRTRKPTRQVINNNNNKKPPKKKKKSPSTKAAERVKKLFLS